MKMKHSLIKKNIDRTNLLNFSNLLLVVVAHNFNTQVNQLNQAPIKNVKDLCLFVFST